MNAAMLGGNLVSIYTLVLMSIAGTTEIFVGQNNGANRYDRIASPVWQMVYFALLSLLFVIPLGFFTDSINLIPPYYATEGITYQRILTYFCWTPALTAAFTGFFVGRGSTKIVTLSVVSGVITDIILDYLLIFGYGDTIPECGCAGAAIATVIAEVVQVAILAATFWSRKNRRDYGTLRNRKFDCEVFRKCIKIGLPMSIGRCAEMLAWYLVYAILSHTSKDLATVQGFAVTVYVLFAFICDGLFKGSAAISANFIGQHNLQDVGKACKKLMVATLLLCFVSTVPLVISQELLFKMLNLVKGDISHLYGDMAIIFRLLSANVTLEAVSCVFCGFLFSGGDTKYPIIVNLTCLWTAVVLPILGLSLSGKLHSAIIVQQLSLICNSALLIAVYLRYRSMKWYHTV
jgi:MATE family multidrug resistance protein